MRSRISALVLSAILVISFAACSKKDQSQNQPTMANSAASSAQANQPATSTTPMQNQPAASAPAQQQQQQQWLPLSSSLPSNSRRLRLSPPPPPPPPPPPLVVPAGTSLVVRMGNTIDTKTANPGDSFTGVLAHSVAVNGVVAIKAGAGWRERWSMPSHRADSKARASCRSP